MVLLEKTASAIWGWPMMVLFLGVGLLFTLRLSGVQLRHLRLGLRLISRSGHDGVSPYAALCTALAATIGTGNIVGVATALQAGGPGALFWMLLAAVLGMATQYAEGFLAVKYRARGKTGWFGGPFSYMRRGLGFRWRWLGTVYALTGAVVGLLGVGTVTQVNSITTAVDAFLSSSTAFCLFGTAYSKATVYSGLAVALAAAFVLLGGVRRIFQCCETLVPLMSAAYVLCCLILLACCAEQLPAAVLLILRSAFRPRAVLGAGLGIGLREAMRMGIGRGVLTNEAGMGTTSIAAAAAGEGNPVRQGLVTMTGTFFDTVVICTMTGLCIVVTGAWSASGEGVALTNAAWAVGLPWSARLSAFILMVCLIFFAFATIIGWNFYAISCVQFLTKSDTVQKIYRWGYLLAVLAGPYLPVAAVWELADILNASIALPNLLALLLLQRQVVEGTKKWFALNQKKEQGTIAFRSPFCYNKEEIETK